MACHHISGHVAKLDPNWHSVSIRFNDLHSPQRKLVERPLTDKDACLAEFDYRPAQVILVGPKVGHVLLTEEIFWMIPEPLLALMRMCDVFKPWTHSLKNKGHVIELIEGRTIIQFENCVSGVVRNVRGDEFDVEHFESNLGPSPCDGKVEHYTRARLVEELKMDDCRCQAVDVRYLPYLPHNGRPMDTVEAVREANRVAREEWEAEEPARRAQRDALIAARRAGLSQEKRAEEEAYRERLKAQAEVAHALLPHLPKP